MFREKDESIFTTKDVKRFSKALDRVKRSTHGYTWTKGGVNCRVYAKTSPTIQFFVCNDYSEYCPGIFYFESEAEALKSINKYKDDWEILVRMTTGL